MESLLIISIRKNRHCSPWTAFIMAFHYPVLAYLVLSPSLYFIAPLSSLHILFSEEWNKNILIFTCRCFAHFSGAVFKSILSIPRAYFFLPQTKAIFFPRGIIVKAVKIVRFIVSRIFFWVAGSYSYNEKMCSSHTTFTTRCPGSVPFCAHNFLFYCWITLCFLKYSKW